MNAINFGVQCILCKPTPFIIDCIHIHKSENLMNMINFGVQCAVPKLTLLVSIILCSNMCKQDWSSISGVSLDISQDVCQVFSDRGYMG